MQPLFNQLPPLSLYIHIPWCIRKCPYCDFNSHTAAQELPEHEYIQALLDDLDQDIHYVQGRRLNSIFFGGGTPSLFSADGIATLLSAVAQRIPLADPIEITLEANPGTFEQKKFSGYRKAGVNRLSIGIQSFHNKQLQNLGRIHNADEAVHAIEQATASGFDNINLDLMHGLPGQSIEQALADLTTALRFKPAHLSWYQLTIEPNTEFFKRPPRLPDDDDLFSIEQQGQALLAAQGYRQYEVSAYSLAQRQCLHNLNYWRFGDYLGIGAGAHGKITLSDQQQIIRTQKTRAPKDYMKAGADKTTACDPIPVTAIAGEFAMNALRLNQGFSATLFERTTGLSIQAIQTLIEETQQDGLLEHNRQIKPTGKGRLFLNELIARFI